MRLLSSGVLLATGLTLCACDPMPMVSLKNETAGEVKVRFLASVPGEVGTDKAYKLRPREDADLPAGYMFRNHMVVEGGGCRWTFPVVPEATIDGSMGGQTPLAIGSDWRLYVRDPSVQPKGWPVAPSSKACG